MNVHITEFAVLRFRMFYETFKSQNILNVR